MKIFTGKRCILPHTLVDKVGRLIDEDKLGNIIVLVPDQLTLETEIMLFRELNLPGSFSVTVVSPKRLCSRVFEEAGKPMAVTIDEMGRAMIMGKLLRQNRGRLKYYKRAVNKPGFEERIISEIRTFKQAGIMPEGIEELINEQNTPGRNDRLSDFAMLYREYEKKLSGHIQDGEDEIRTACERFSASDFIKNARVVVYGFDITTAVVNRLITALSRHSRDVQVLLPLSDNGRGVYQPLKDAVNRLTNELRNAGIDFTLQTIDTAPAVNGDAGILADGIFSGAKGFSLSDNSNLRLVKLKDEQEEARFTAATVRRLVKENNWRYCDVRVVTYDSQTSQDTLESAFEEYDIPFFTQEGRSAVTNPLCVFLTESLRLASGRPCSLSALLASGYTDLSREEAEDLMYYMKALSIKEYRINSPFTRGLEDPRLRLACAEKARCRLMGPVNELGNGLKDSKDLKSQLTAVYDYMTKLDCAAKAEKIRESLVEMGLGAQAADNAQIWNKLMNTLDQMLELLGPDCAKPEDISDMIERALGSVSVKQLPLSPDCVEICPPERMGMLPVKAVILMGAVQEGNPGGNGVFTASELKDMSDKLKKYLRPDVAALTKTRRMYAKDLFYLAGEYLLITYHGSTAAGEAVGASAIVNELKRIFGESVKEHISEAEMETLLMSARKGALDYLSGKMNEEIHTAPRLEAMAVLSDEDTLKRAAAARSFNWKSAPIAPEVASKLYRDSVSISRLETFAGCPFASFISAGIKPDENEPFELKAADRGSILHECVEKLGNILTEESLSESDAQMRMDILADEVLGKTSFADVVGDTAVSKATADGIKKVARRAARIFARQARNRDFKPLRLEMEFGKNEGCIIKLSTGQTIEFKGKIDRIDSGIYNGKRYVSIVDYKSSDKSLKPEQIYLGTQLQLLIYLSVAARLFSAECAGAFYFSMKNDMPVCDARNAESARAELEKKEKLDGIVPDDAELLNFMTDDPTGIYGIAVKGDTVGRSDSKKASSEEFRLLMDYVNHKAKELTEEMFSGVTEIRPEQKADDGACRYCNYANVCFRANVAPYRKPDTSDIKGKNIRNLYDEIRKMGI